MVKTVTIHLPQCSPLAFQLSKCQVGPPCPPLRCSHIVFHFLPHFLACMPGKQVRDWSPWGLGQQTWQKNHCITCLVTAHVSKTSRGDQGSHRRGLGHDIRMALQIIIINVKLGPRFSPSLLRQNTRLNSIAHLGPEALCVFLSCSIQCFSFLILALSAVVHCLLGTQCLFFHLNYLFPMLCLAHSALVHGAVFLTLKAHAAAKGAISKVPFNRMI